MAARLLNYTNSWSIQIQAQTSKSIQPPETSIPCGIFEGIGKKKCISGLWVSQEIWILRTFQNNTLYPKHMAEGTPQYRLHSFIWSQITRATLPLFTELPSAKPLSPEAILLWEENAGVSRALCAVSGQLQDWSTEMISFITRELEGEDESCKSPPYST